MRVKSTGLGPRELQVEPEDIWLERKGKFLILHMNSSQPVQWHLRTALTTDDLRKIIELLIDAILDGSVISLLLKGTEEEEPPEY